MKKILILSMLIAPIAATAGKGEIGGGQTVGPAAATGGPNNWFVATASAPYATASTETGDSTTVVSASYVKGAYNDLIAAVNKVNTIKQNILVDEDSAQTINSTVKTGLNGATNSDLVSGLAVKNAITDVNSILSRELESKRISAVTTWGDDDNPTQLTLSTASE